MDGADHRERVEPVPDAARPEQDLVVRTDPGDDAAQRRAGLRRLRIDAEGDDVDERAQRRVARVALAVEATGARERAEPEVALLLARADECVACRERDFLGQEIQLRHGRAVGGVLLAGVEAGVAPAWPASTGHR